MTKRAVTVYLDVEPYQELRSLIQPKPISQETNGLIRKQLVDLQGKEYTHLTHIPLISE